MTDPVEALTRAFLEADGYDPDLELNARDGLGIAETYQKFAEIAVDTLKGIGWGPKE